MNQQTRTVDHKFNETLQMDRVLAKTMSKYSTLMPYLFKKIGRNPLSIIKNILLEREAEEYMDYIARTRAFIDNDISRNDYTFRFLHKYINTQPYSPKATYSQACIYVPVLYQAYEKEVLPDVVSYIDIKFVERRKELLMKIYEYLKLNDILKVTEVLCECKRNCGLIKQIEMDETFVGSLCQRVRRFFHHTRCEPFECSIENLPKTFDFYQCMDPEKRDYYLNEEDMSESDEPDEEE
jgi:hypothetical protein